MNLRQVEVFRRVFEARSVTRAAEALAISQPAVSKHIAALERACGFALFDRTGGRLVPTPEGRLLAVEVERLFRNTRRLEHIARGIAERRFGSVRLAAFPALSNRVLPAVLAPTLASRPELRFTLESRTSPRIVEMVADQEIDLGFSLLSVEHPLVECTCACDFALVAVLPPGHRLARKSRIRAADLRDEPFISLGAADRSRTVVDRAFGPEDARPRSQIEAQMAEAACCFVAQGLGVTIVPPFVAQTFAKDGLVVRPFRPEIRMRIWQLIPAGDPVAAVTRELATEVRQALSPFESAPESTGPAAICR